MAQYRACDRWVHALFEHHGCHRMAAVVKPSLRVESSFGHEPLGRFAEGVGVERAAVAAIAGKVEVVPANTELQGSFRLLPFG